MPRYANRNWDLPEPKVETWEQASVAVLMDIRDELAKLNRLLHCSNFMEIPHVLRGIRRKMPAPRPRRVRKPD